MQTTILTGWDLEFTKKKNHFFYQMDTYPIKYIFIQGVSEKKIVYKFQRSLQEVFKLNFAISSDYLSRPKGNLNSIFAI